MAETGKRVAIESILSPGRTKNVDADRYGDMRQAMLASLTVGPPGITAAELKKLILRAFRKSCFPAAPRRAGGSRACSSISKRKGWSAVARRPRSASMRSRKSEGRPLATFHGLLTRAATAAPDVLKSAHLRG